MNNPTAFPIVTQTLYDVHSEGLTMRDYFAAHALTGLMQSITKSAELGTMKAENIGSTALAKGCYQIADAMLLERERNKK